MKLLGFLRRPAPHYSVTWEGWLYDDKTARFDTGILRDCSSVQAHRVGRYKAEQGLEVRVIRWEGHNPLTEWTNA